MAAEACPINIGRRGQWQRMRFGIIALVVAAGLGAALVFLHASHLLRLLVFVPAVVAGYGIFQAREKT